VRDAPAGEDGQQQEAFDGGRDGGGVQRPEAEGAAAGVLEGGDQGQGDGDDRAGGPGD